MARVTYHVVPHMDGGWKVRKGGAKRATKKFKTKNEAVKWGRAFSKSHGTEFYIHKEDGTLERKLPVGVEFSLTGEAGEPVAKTFRGIGKDLADESDPTDYIQRLRGEWGMVE